MNSYIMTPVLHQSAEHVYLMHEVRLPGTLRVKLDYLHSNFRKKTVMTR